MTGYQTYIRLTSSTDSNVGGLSIRSTKHYTFRKELDEVCFEDNKYNKTSLLNIIHY